MTIQSNRAILVLGCLFQRNLPWHGPCDLYFYTKMVIYNEEERNQQEVIVIS